MLSCVECGHHVSPSARHCPGCGTPFYRSGSRALSYLFLVALLAVLGLLYTGRIDPRAHFRYSSHRSTR